MFQLQVPVSSRCQQDVAVNVGLRLEMCIRDRFRTVYVNEPMDRVVLGIANDLLFELMPEMLHSSCKSYQTRCV